MAHVTTFPLFSFDSLTVDKKYRKRLYPVLKAPIFIVNKRTVGLEVLVAARYCLFV